MFMTTREKDMEKASKDGQRDAEANRQARPPEEKHLNVAYMSGYKQAIADDQDFWAGKFHGY